MGYGTSTSAFPLSLAQPLVTANCITLLVYSHVNIRLGVEIVN